MVRDPVKMPMNPTLYYNPVINDQDEGAIPYPPLQFSTRPFEALKPIPAPVPPYEDIPSMDIHIDSIYSKNLTELHFLGIPLYRINTQKGQSSANIGDCGRDGGIFSGETCYRFEILDQICVVGNFTNQWNPMPFGMDFLEEISEKFRGIFVEIQGANIHSILSEFINNGVTIAEISLLD